MTTERRIYLDHNATTPLRPEAAEAMTHALALGGNPSSVHAEGRKARALLEKSRESVAAFIGGQAKNVTFTSGATEALNLALTPSLKAGADARPWRLYVSATEHAAVLNGHRFTADSVELVPVGSDGVMDVDHLDQLLEAHPEAKPLVALQFANSETGVIQPVCEVAARVHARGGLVVCDAVQAAGKISVSMEELGGDVVVLSGHKIGGPAGVGALIRASDSIQFGEALIRGGGQERGLRGGTENLPGAAGLAAACAVLSATRADAVHSAAPAEAAFRDAFETALRALDPQVRIFGADSARLPNTSCFALPALPAELALIALDLAGFAVSSGSACSSGKVKSSHVLEAMGVAPDIAKCMLRISFGWTTRASDVDQILEALARLRANNPAAGKVLAA